MYRLIKTDGTELGVTEHAMFIRRKAESGALIPCEAWEAQGVAFRGSAYNLADHEGVGADDSVIVCEYDGGDYDLGSLPLELASDFEERICLLEMGVM